MDYKKLNEQTRSVREKKIGKTNEWIDYLSNKLPKVGLN